MSMDPDLPELVSIRLAGGRLPEKAGEILLPEHLLSNGNVRYVLGDTVTVDLGRRTVDGHQLTAHNPYVEGETLEDTKSRTYTVVGFYRRLDTEVEPFSCPGYTALTCGEQGYQTDEFFRVAHPSRFYSYMEGNAEKYPGLAWYSNSTLLNYYGATRILSVNRLLYDFAAILLLMISFGSVSLIYNSFSISVAERTRQFGILKSIGATRKQIRDSVLYEALVLCAVGIPLGLLVGCLGIGVTLYCLRGSFGFLPGGESGGAVEMRFVLNLWAVLAAAGIGLITAVISAWIPARRAVRLSPIEAIRQTQDVKIRSREVKTSPLTGKLFGFSGMLAAKNFKRDRKRYRSTVVGLFLSVTLFISASSFCAYLTGAVTRLSSDGMGVQLYYSEALPEDVTPEQRRVGGQGLQLLRRRQDAQQNGQVIHRAFLALARRGQVHGDAADGEFGPAGLDGGPDPLPGFPHRRVRQAHHVEGGQSPGQKALHRHLIAADAVESQGPYRYHHDPSHPLTKNALVLRFLTCFIYILAHIPPF